MLFLLYGLLRDSHAQRLLNFLRYPTFRIVAAGVNGLRHPDRAMIVITHYQRLLNYIVPDFVHVMSKGRVVKSGGKELALELEASGYAQFEDAA